MEVPENPLVFAKFTGCISAPNAEIELRSDAADYEAELVVVIGTAGRDIPEASAWDHVFGLTVGQDISDRALQFAAKPPHFDLGKSRDTYGPVGPVVIAPDGVEDRDALGLGCSVNGETRQEGSTADMIFPVAYLIHYISKVVTLQPGDLIFTGTPAGIGAMQLVFLQPGDVIETWVEGIGRIRNECVA